MAPCAPTEGVIVNVSIANVTLIVWSAVTFGERVAGEGADRDAVDEHVGDVVVGGRGDGEDRVVTVGDRLRGGPADRAVGAGRVVSV